MSSFSRQQYRFFAQGVFLSGPMDLCPPGKWPVLQNVRSYSQGTLQGRDGMVLLANTGFGGVPVHTIARLSDTTPFATIPARFFFGAGASVFSGPAGGPYPSLDTGYSGLPLCCLSLEPSGSPQPWLYTADSTRMRKFNVNGLSYPIGVASPVPLPIAELYTIGINLIASFNLGLAGWTSVGASASALAVTVPDRVNTTITSLLYDSGTTGNVSIVPASMSQISEGMMLLVNGVDLVQVSQVTIAIAPTTIGSIIYDSGTSGLCTIQPAASLGTGTLDIPSLADERSRTLQNPLPPGATGRAVPRGTAGLPNPYSFDPLAPLLASTFTRRIRQLDFPVNSLVLLGGTELVRVLSVTTGPDEIQSFRCVTAATFAAGATLTGVAGFRAWVPSTYAPGQTLFDAAVTNTIQPLMPPATTTPATVKATAGIISAVVPQNLAQITVGGATRPILPDEDVHLAIRADDLTKVASVRVYFDVDPGTNDFTRNYYFFEWRANDLIAAIQNTNTADVAPILQAQATANASAIIAQPRVPGSLLPTPPKRYHGPNQPTEPTPETQPLGLGNHQWIDLRCKVRQLVHVGTDPSRTLADVQRVEILVSVETPVDYVAMTTPSVTIDYDTLYISGGFGTDVGGVGPGYRYRYSYRSSTTGAESNASPATRAGVTPRRQRVILTGTQSADPQVDLVDWWRFGGALTKWTRVGTTANTNPPVFNDDYSDQSLDGGEALATDNFQPWTSTDLPRAGTCNVAGNAVRWVSGPKFNTSWAEGSYIIVNSRVYTLSGPPVTDTLLFLVESAGSGTAVPFTVTAATLVSQVMPVLFGGPINGVVFTFGLGDIRNPSTLYWTKGNEPDEAPDSNTLIVTPPSEPLQNGIVFDGLPYVFSTDDQYVIEPDFANPNQFRALVTPCGRGLWSRWAICETPHGIAFLAKDGIGITRGGSTALMITDRDLYPIFPHDGIPGVAVNGFSPVNMTVTARLKLSFCDGYLYFDYQDTDGNLRSIAFRFADQSWWPDRYTPGISARYAEPGALAHDMLLGGVNGQVFSMGGVTDNGTSIACLATKVENQGDGRTQKLYRDVMLEVDGGGVSTVTLTLGLTNNTVLQAPVVITLAAGRQPYYTNLNPTTMDAYGTNLTMALAWSPFSVTGPAPLFYLFDIAYQLEPELSTNWLSGPTTHGLPGFQQVPLILLAYRSNSTATFTVIIDGVTFTYGLPSTGGLYAKKMFRLQSRKGLTYQYGFQAPAQAAFQLFDVDCEVWIQAWGFGGGYQKVKPFSGPGGLLATNQDQAASR